MRGGGQCNQNYLEQGPISDEAGRAHILLNFKNSCTMEPLACFLPNGPGSGSSAAGPAIFSGPGNSVTSGDPSSFLPPLTGLGYVYFGTCL